MSVTMKQVREWGWRITYTPKSKSSGRVFTHIGTKVSAKTKKGVLERFAKFRERKEKGGVVFENVSEPFKYDEMVDYLCF